MRVALWVGVGIGCQAPVQVASPDRTDAPPEVEPPVATSRTTPIYGGTMSVDQQRILVADPGLDRITLTTPDLALVHRFQFEEGAAPFRSHIDGNSAYVVLRGTGQVAKLNLLDFTVTTANVCVEPRGIDTDANGLVVACASGDLVELDRDLVIQRSAQPGPDLRDVVIEGAVVWVSSFRSSEVMRLDRTTLEVEYRALPDLSPTVQSESTGRVAWRMHPHPDGGVLVLHSAQSNRPIELDPGKEEATPAYGGGNVCTGETVSTTHLTWLHEDDIETSAALPFVSPAYDFWVEADGVWVPNLAPPLLGAPLSFTTAAYIPFTFIYPFEGPCLDFAEVDAFEMPMPATSIVRIDGRTVVFRREPSHLSSLDVQIDLGDTYSSNEAFDAFHELTPSGLACATCHPEGQDDGHVWLFEDLGPRRTQNLAGGVMQRAPFHWDGEFTRLDQLMEDVFLGRMGVSEVPDVPALGEWMDRLPPTQPNLGDDEQIYAGQMLFESPALGCADCHRGPQMSDAQRHLVRPGQTVPTKTPSLIAVGARAPYMSDGCAPTLRDRFLDPECGGGDSHGVTSQLQDEELNALIDYLKSL
ncbi:MAG: hypothetical protein AAGA48_09015 [Myxococcota bacterium]